MGPPLRIRSQEGATPPLRQPTAYSPLPTASCYTKAMKFLHWLIFSIAFWLVLSPLVGDDIIALFLPGQSISPDQFLQFVRWDDFFLGLTVMILALVVITLESASHKTPGLKAMHWLQVLLAAFVALAPFIFALDYNSYVWSHLMSGGFIAIFALLQIYLEPKR